MRITRTRFSDSVKFFEPGFKQRWNLGDYSPDEPALFVGCYSQKDVNAILSHVGRKLVMFLGNDIGSFEHLKRGRDITFVINTLAMPGFIGNKEANFIDAVIPVRDFSAFNPTPMGDKIYVYMNRGTDAHKLKHGINSLGPVIEYFGADKFIFGVHGKTEPEYIADYYTPAFINIQFNRMAGFTSALEMAHMGRKSISNATAPFAIPFKTLDDIIEIILREQENKNEPRELVGDYLYSSDDWLSFS